MANEITPTSGGTLTDAPAPTPAPMLAPTPAPTPTPTPAPTSLTLTGYHLTFDWEGNDFNSSPVPGQAEWTTTLSAYPNSQGLRTLGNGDQEYWTDPSTGKSPFQLDNGVLNVNATYVGAGNTPGGGSLSYDSGLMTTQGSFSQQYGYFEMRAELPQGAGMWPAYWMLPDNSYLPGNWPPELDVMEAFGATAADGEGGANQAHWDVHSTNTAQQAGGWATINANEYDSYNTYGVLWTPQTLTFYYDGQEAAQTPTPTDFTQKMYLIANLAVGGTWPGDATGEDATMKIDYIRAFSSDSSIPAVALQTISSPDGGGYSLYGATARAPATHDDFNGNGVSDVLWQNSSNGDTGYWSMNGGQASWVDLGASSSSAYSIVGAGDFNGDGTSDILWRNNTSGDTGYWAMPLNGVQPTWDDIGTASTAYTVVGVGDFNGDGTADILWRNASNGDTGFWAMSGGKLSGWHDIGLSGTAYQVAGVGDFTGDGTSDILWQNPTTNDLGIYLLTASGQATWQDLGDLSFAYSVVGTGDFTGNGIDDILFRDSANGDTGYWAMNSSAQPSWVDLGTSSTAYNVISLGDFTGDGSTDIMFRNNATGDTGYWAMSGGHVSGWQDIGVSSTAYTVPKAVV